MKKLDLKKNLIPYIITGIMFSANSPWPIWLSGNNISFILIIWLCFILRKKIRYISNNIFIFICIFLLPVFIILPLFRGWHFSGVIYILAFIAIMSVKKEDLIKAFNYITNVLAWIIIFSLPFWLFHIYIHPLNPIGIIDLGAYKGVIGTVRMEIYGVFVTNSQVSEAFRFYSVFDEPGVLGTLSAFVLYGNRYDFSNWKVWVILIGSFFTYSMAFIVLSIFGFMILNLKNFKKIAMTFLVLLLLTEIALIALQNNIAFQQSVVYRLTEQRLDDQVEGRNSEDVNKVFEQNLLNFEGFIGIGDNAMVNRNLRIGASYKHFMLEYGIIGLITVLILYIIMMRRSYKIDYWGAFLLFFLSFAQRPLIWTGWQIILFACIIANLSKHSNNVKTPQYQNRLNINLIYQ